MARDCELMKCTINYNGRGDCILACKAPRLHTRRDVGEYYSRFSRRWNFRAWFPARNVAARSAGAWTKRTIYRFEILALCLLIQPRTSSSVFLRTRRRIWWLAPLLVGRKYLWNRVKGAPTPRPFVPSIATPIKILFSTEGENARIMRTPLSTPEDRIFQQCTSKAHKRRRRPIMLRKYLNKVTSSSLLLLYYGKVTLI